MNRFQNISYSSCYLDFSFKFIIDIKNFFIGQKVKNQVFVDIVPKFIYKFWNNVNFSRNYLIMEGKDN